MLYIATTTPATWMQNSCQICTFDGLFSEQLSFSSEALLRKEGLQPL